MEKKPEEQRTDKQNASMHLYFRLLAEALNEHGLDMKTVLKPGVEIPWNERMVKEFLWRPIQKVMTDKDSTTELNTVGPSDVHKVLDRMLAEKFGVSVDWPSLRG